MTLVTLQDFEVRYKNLRASHPDNPDCTVQDCNNPVDVIRYGGTQSTCAYHRLIFDRWFSNLSAAVSSDYLVNKGERRAAFKNYLTVMPKSALDKIVLAMASEPINWEC